MTGKPEQIAASFSNPEGMRRGETLEGDPAIRGNQFLDYPSQVERAWQLWKVKRQYGGLPFRTIISHLLGIICGNGAAVVSTENRKTKLINTLLIENPLDGSMLTTIARAGLFEGRVLLVPRRIPATEERPTETVHWTLLRWIDWKYEVYLSESNFDQIDRIEYSSGTAKKTLTFGKDKFIYVVFDDEGASGSENRKAEYPTPMAAALLSLCIHEDDARADWRSMNAIWGALGEHYESPDPDTAAATKRWLDERERQGGLHSGDITTAPAKRYFSEPSGRGQESIQNEISDARRTESGYTGVGIHLIGHAREMSNRATATEMPEAHAVVAQFRETLEQQVVRAMIDMSLRILGYDKNTDVSASIAKTTNHQTKELIDVWLPLFDAGFLPRRAIQEMIPGWKEEWAEWLKEEEAENAEKMAKANQALLDGALRDEPQNGGTENDPIDAT